MDSVTQIVLGAAVGEACLGKKLGNKALLWGAIMGTIPDLDVFTRFFLDTVDGLHAHRAMSHSLLFFFVSAPVFGMLLKRIYAQKEISFRAWTNMCFWTLSTHAYLDCFTTWGTQLFWPFSTYPVAFKTIFVVDPLYTVPFLICVILVLFFKRERPFRHRINTLGLVISTLYLGWTVVNKFRAIDVFENSLHRQNINFNRLDTKPGVINNILWVGTVETTSDFLIGYHSFFDHREEITFRPYPKNHHLLGPFENAPQVKKLLQLFDGYYTVEPSENGVIINDLRFGQYAGWKKEGGGFVFSYLVVPNPEKDGETLITAQPRNKVAFAGMLKELWTRIKGV